MPEATNPTDGTRVHYEAEGQGPPLVLYHGFTASLQDWHDAGYVEALGHDYRLILPDARGHGRSGKPHTVAAYSPSLVVDDVVSVLDDAEVERAHFFGYSMGGRVGFDVLARARSRLLSLIVGGQHPYGPEKWLVDMQRDALRSGGMEKMVADLEELLGRIPEPRRSAMLANDAEALLASVEAAGERESLEGELTTATTPTLVFAGDADGSHDRARAAAEQMPNAEFRSLERLNHGAAFMRSDLVLPHVTQFLARVSEPTAA